MMMATMMRIVVVMINEGDGEHGDDICRLTSRIGVLLESGWSTQKKDFLCLEFVNNMFFLTIFRFKTENRLTRTSSNSNYFEFPLTVTVKRWQLLIYIIYRYYIMSYICYIISYKCISYIFMSSFHIYE